MQFELPPGPACTVDPPWPPPAPTTPGFGFTQMPLKHSSPGSHTPPWVHAHLSEPMLQSLSPSSSVSEAAHAPAAAPKPTTTRRTIKNRRGVMSAVQPRYHRFLRIKA